MGARVCKVCINPPDLNFRLRLSPFPLFSFLSNSLISFHSVIRSLSFVTLQSIYC
nr:MAG TPA: hypothetical protein [Caudoviricetes sp.]